MRVGAQINRTELPAIGGLMSGSRIEDAVSDVVSETEDADVDVKETEAEAERPSRRNFFLGAAAVATAAMIPARTARAQRIQRPRPPIMTRPGAPSSVGNDTL